MKNNLLLCIVAGLIILSGCSTSKKNDVSQSYVPMVNVDGIIYTSFSLTKHENYTEDEVFGEIEKRVPSSEIQKKNLTSNYYDKGTVIYTVKEDKAIFLIEQSPGVHSTLEKIE